MAEMSINEIVVAEDCPFWTSAREGALIEEWSRHPCLFDCTSVEYKNKEKRRTALEAIGLILNVEAEEVNKKIHSLRSAYTRATKIAKSGSSAAKLTERKSWIRQRLGFLQPFVKGRPSVTNLQDERTESYSEDEGQEESFDTLPTPPTDSSTPAKLKRKSRTVRRDEEEMNLLREIAKSCATDSSAPTAPPRLLDEDDLFGEYIAKSLKKLDIRNRAICKNAIQNILFQYQMGDERPQQHQEKNQQQYQQQPTSVSQDFSYSSVHATDFYPTYTQL